MQIADNDDEKRKPREEAEIEIEIVVLNDCLLLSLPRPAQVRFWPRSNCTMKPQNGHGVHSILEVYCEACCQFLTNVWWFDPRQP